MTTVDRYEIRRLALLDLVKRLGYGSRRKIAEKIGREPSYVSRMLMPSTSSGRKNIGENLVEALNAAFPGWLDNAPSIAEAVASNAEHPATTRIVSAAASVRPTIAALDLRATTLAGLAGGSAAPGQFTLFQQEGEAMTPIIMNGETALVDTAKTSATTDGYYLLKTGAGGLQISLLQWRGTSLWVIAPNKDYPEWCAESADSLGIVGRIVAKIAITKV